MRRLAPAWRALSDKSQGAVDKVRMVAIQKRIKLAPRIARMGTDKSEFSYPWPSAHSVVKSDPAAGAYAVRFTPMFT